MKGLISYFLVAVCVALQILEVALEVDLSDPKHEVKIEVLFKPPNCRKLSKIGDILTTDYLGYFPGGKKFDSTYDRKEPMIYTMGNGEVIKGCEIGTMNMCQGEKRRLTIPPNLAYGDGDYGQIPGGSTLMFDIELTDLGSFDM